MPKAKRADADGYFTLAAWCTVTKAWVDHEQQFASAAEAQAAALQARGIYRISYLCNGRRLDLEPFGFIGHE
jgi:hypothetical protein